MSRLNLEMAPNGGWIVSSGVQDAYSQQVILAAVGSTDELLKYLADELRYVTPPAVPVFKINGGGK